MKRAEGIFALATASARSALHIHRISGTGIFATLDSCLVDIKNKAPLSLPTLAQTYSGKPVSRYVLFQCPTTHRVLDDGMVTLYPAPHSYTGEDLIEFTSHGNTLIASEIHNILRTVGLHDAEPGEFTYRAVLNGKMDVIQAEGVSALIESHTWGGISLARTHTSSVLSQAIHSIQKNIIQILAYLEAHIDFAPDEVGSYNPQTLIPLLHTCCDDLQRLATSYDQGLKLRQGLRVALVGAPNAGKSTLYNALLGHDRAIVTEIPGTTRDVLEDRFALQARDFVLLDTAGIHHTTDVVERLGVERSHKALHSADVVCFVVDGSKSTSWAAVEEQWKNILSADVLKHNSTRLVVFTKKDLLKKDEIEQWRESSTNHPEKFVFTAQTDICELQDALRAIYDDLAGNPLQIENPILSSQRQKNKVDKSLEILRSVEFLLQTKTYPEMIAADIYHASQTLTELTGGIALEDVFGEIFSTFCIGK